MGVVGLSYHVNHCSQSSYLRNIYMFYYIIPFCATSSHLWNDCTDTLSTCNSSLLLLSSSTAEEHLQMFSSCLTYSCVRLHVYTPSCLRLHVYTFLCASSCVHPFLFTSSCVRTYTPSCLRLHVYTFLFTSSCVHVFMWLSHPIL